MLPLTLTAEVLAPDWIDGAWRLGLAAFLAGLVGAERAQDAQIAGIRTHAVLAIGSALTMLVSMHVAAHGPEHLADPGRVAAQVVSGIGFLGAGAIIRLGTNVRGLTTAASLWTVAGIGLAVGAGYVTGALIATVLLIVVLNVIDRVMSTARFGRHSRTLRCEAEGSARLQSEVAAALASRRVDSKVVSVRADRDPARVSYEFRLRVPEGVTIEQILESLTPVTALRSTRIE